MNEHLKNIEKGYVYKNNLLYFKHPHSNTFSKVAFKVLKNEEHLISDFVKCCNRLPKRKRQYINEIRNNHTLYGCWYYCKVWDYTLQGLSIDKIPPSKVIDHIYPISKGLKYKVPPILIGNINNIQFISSKDNLIKADTIPKLK